MFVVQELISSKHVLFKKAGLSPTGQKHEIRDFVIKCTTDFVLNSETCLCWWWQTCLVYAVGIENYRFEIQTTHLRLHYTNYANDFVSATHSDKCDSVLFFDAILFLTQPPCSKGMWAHLWYARIKSCNSDAGFGANIGSERSRNSFQLGENVRVEEASVWNFFRRRFSVSLRQRLCYCD